MKHFKEKKNKSENIFIVSTVQLLNQFFIHHVYECQFQCHKI